MVAKQKVNPYMSLLEIPPGYLNIMGFANSSEISQPNKRAVVWVQGCLRECPGCFDPSSWSFDINQLISTEDLVQKILSDPQNEGVIFSGGEPFWQAPALTEVAKKVRAIGLNVMAFSGFTLKELQSPYAPARSKELLANLDILIDGSFVESLKVNLPNSLVSSENQKIHIFNSILKKRITWGKDRTESHVLNNNSKICPGHRRKIPRDL